MFWTQLGNGLAARHCTLVIDDVARAHQQPRHANQARLQFLDERRCIAALELAANAHLSLRRRCHAPEKQISRNIETNS